MNSFAQTKRPAWAPAFACSGERKRSAGGLAAARDSGLLLQPLHADGADHDLLADDVAGRAVEAHILGELEVLLDRGLHLRARQILLDLRGVEAGFLGCR